MYAGGEVLFSCLDYATTIHLVMISNTNYYLIIQFYKTFSPPIDLNVLGNITLCYLVLTTLRLTHFGLK